MTPPFAAQVLVAAVTPPADYESVAGDLYEEYADRAELAGRTAADHWYWSQAIRSIPSLLLYSRSSRSLVASIATAAIVVFALVAMLILNELIGDAIFTVYRNVTGFGAWPFFLAGWMDAAFFGAVLAAIRQQGIRLTLIASFVLVAIIVIPILLGFSAPLSLHESLLLAGAVPAMSAGAVVFQIVRSWRLIRHLAVALSVVLLAAAAAGGADAPYESAQRLVEVGGGRHLNLYCSGAGSPVVVLEAAIGSSMYVWHKVQPALAQHARVCSYDRAGYGFSDPGGPPHTTSQNVADLHSLLTNAHVKPPYILVAHSLNAFDARLFADRYRGELAGMVLVDPSEVGEARFGSIYGKKKSDADTAANLKFIQTCTRKAERHLLKSGDDCVGPPDLHLAARLRRVQEQHDTAPALWDAVLSEETSLNADLREVTSQQRRYGNLPLLVLTAGAAEDGEKQQGASIAQIAAAKRLWKQLRDNDAAFSNRGINCVIPGVSHYVQLDKPEVVIEAVLQIIGDSKRAVKPSCARLL